MGAVKLSGGFLMTGKSDLSFTGLTEDQSFELHRVYMSGLTVFVIACIIAHLATWQMFPWFNFGG